MINADRMLGSLVRGAIGGGRRRRRRGLGGLATGAVGLGALGLAFAAFEHFTQKQGAGGSSQPSSPPARPPAGSAPLPPLPGSSDAPLPPLPTTETEGEQEPSAEALLLIRAMIAAANADYEIDAEERARIEGALEEADLSSEERDFLRTEMETPWDLGRVAESASTPDLARQIYLASLMAIEVDSAAEENYLARLAARIGLDDAAIREMEDLLELDLDRDSESSGA